MRGWSAGEGWDEGMMGGLRGAGRKRRGVRGGNEAAHLFTPDDPVRDGLIGGGAGSRGTAPSLSVRRLINRSSSRIRPAAEAQLMWSLYSSVCVISSLSAKLWLTN